MPAARRRLVLTLVAIAGVILVGLVVRARTSGTERTPPNRAAPRARNARSR